MKFKKILLFNLFLFNFFFLNLLRRSLHCSGTHNTLDSRNWDQAIGMVLWYFIIIINSTNIK